LTDELLERLIEGVRVELRAALADRPRDVLDVEAVRARYRLRDRRAARAVMVEAGAFRVGRRLYVQRETLERWERGRVELPTTSTTGSDARRRSGTRTRKAEPLQPGFWRE
jgi:hypothetical protein